MADMHNRHHASGEAEHGGMSRGMMGGGMEGGSMGGMQMPPPSRAAAEDLPEGARIFVTPNDPGDLQRLQSHRPSAMPSPIAPNTHHWLDSTHISFGVVTVGVFGRQWKAPTCD